MTDFGDENDGRESESKRDCAACGLLPREHYRPDATLTVRDDAGGCGTERLYRAVPVRVDAVETTLLVGPRCELASETTYRVLSGRDRRHRERRKPQLVTVEVAEE